LGIGIQYVKSKDLTLKHSQALVLDPSAVGFKITSFVERAKAALLD